MICQGAAPTVVDGMTLITVRSAAADNQHSDQQKEAPAFFLIIALPPFHKYQASPRRRSPLPHRACNPQGHLQAAARKHGLHDAALGDVRRMVCILENCFHSSFPSSYVSWLRRLSRLVFSSSKTVHTRYSPLISHGFTSGSKSLCKLRPNRSEQTLICHNTIPHSASKKAKDRTANSNVAFPIRKQIREYANTVAVRKRSTYARNSGRAS